MCVGGGGGGEKGGGLEQGGEQSVCVCACVHGCVRVCVCVRASVCAHTMSVAVFQPESKVKRGTSDINFNLLHPTNG